MPNVENQPTYPELIYKVVQQSKEPISIDEITQRVELIRPSRSRTPKGTIRSAIRYDCDM